MTRQLTRDEREEILVAQDAIVDQFPQVAEHLRYLAAYRYAPMRPEDAVKIVEEYHGWSNYETWAVHLWISNDEGWLSYWSEVATEMADSPDDEVPTYPGLTRGAVHILADMMSTQFDEDNPLLNSPSVYGDILGHGLQRVDWREVARSMWPE